MKTLLLLFFILSSLLLYSEENLTFKYSFSYPGGIDSVISINTEKFNSSLSVNVSDNKWLLDKGYFECDLFSLGSICFEGFLKKHQSESFFSLPMEKITKVYIDKGVDPSSRKGMILTGTNNLWGFSGFYKDKMEEVLLWKNFLFDQYSSLTFIQSCTFEDKSEIPETWFLEQYLLNSRFLINSSLAFLKNSELFFLGGAVYCSALPEDPPGVSLNVYTGYTISGFLIENGITYNSLFFRTADMKLNKFPLIAKIEISRESDFLFFDSSLIFLLKRKNLLCSIWLWSLKSKSSIIYETSLWKIKSELSISLFNEKDNSSNYTYKLNSSIKRSFSCFYLKGEIMCSYDLFYEYKVKVESGFEKDFLDLVLSSELYIGRKVDIAAFLSGKIKTDHFNFILSYSLENIPLYYCDPDKRKAEFFIGIEIKQEL